jgi:trigger factor
MYEEVLHTGTNMMLSEHPDHKFIWQLYDLHIDDEKPEIISLQFMIDVYPVIKENNTTWMQNKAPKIQNEVSEKEIDETLQNLKRQYANYKEAEHIGEDSVFKVSLSFLDAQSMEVDTGKLYLWKEDIAEFPQLATYFSGKKEWDSVHIAYDDKLLPPTMHTKKTDMQAKELVATVGDIKDMELPEFTPENIKKFFWNDDIKTEQELREKISSLIATQKEESLLMQTIDTYLQEVMKHFTLAIPKTLVNEEVKTRMKSLQEKWEEKSDSKNILIK